jgi:hypothetical protein
MQDNANKNTIDQHGKSFEKPPNLPRVATDEKSQPHVLTPPP